MPDLDRKTISDGEKIACLEHIVKSWVGVMWGIGIQRDIAIIQAIIEDYKNAGPREKND